MSTETLVQVLNYAAWVVSALVAIWLIVDAVRVETTYDHALLVSSVEGEIEKEILLADETIGQPGGAR